MSSKRLSSLCRAPGPIPIRAFALRANPRLNFRIAGYPFMLAPFAGIDNYFSSFFSHAPEYRAQIYYRQVHNLLALSCTL